MHRGIGSPAAGICALVLGLSACALPTPKHRATVEPSTQEVETGAGRWLVRRQPMSPFLSQRQVATQGKNLPSGAADSVLIGQEVAPVVHTPQDLSRLLVNGNLAPDLLAGNMARYMQVIPGVPDRYSDGRFQPVRDAFTAECSQSARGYQSLGIALLRSERFLSDLSSTQTRDTSGDYERNCLTPLDQIPDAVRAVTGVMVNAYGVPWCSATIVGPMKILTARHCFVDPVTGLAMPERQQLSDLRVEFYAIAPHNGFSAFNVRWPSGQEAPLGAFTTAQDYQVLTVTDGTFSKYASTKAGLPKDPTMPRPVWIVGSNATVGDVGDARRPLQFTRGSAPKACAVLEISSNACLYHVCQTGRATSGAGVLEIDSEGSVTLLGVHSATIAEAAGCEASPPTGDRLNLAIAITTKDIGP